MIYTSYIRVGAVVYFTCVVENNMAASKKYHRWMYFAVTLIIHCSLVTSAEPWPLQSDLAQLEFPGIYIRVDYEVV